MAKLSVNQALSKAKSHEKKGEIEEAQKYYKIVLDIFPKNKRAQLGLIDLKRSNKNFVTTNPPQDIIKQLINLYNQGQFQLVVEHSQKLLKQHPKAFVIWNILGAAHKGLGNTDKASLSFKKTTELNPNFADGYNNLGASLHNQGMLEESMLAYHKAISLRPNYVEAYSNLGVLLQENGKIKEAIESYKKAISINPDYAEAHNNIGNAFRDQAKLTEAIGSYNRAISIKPDYAEAYCHMGIALNDQGKLNESIEAYEKATTYKPSYIEAWTNGAEALEKWNRLTQLEDWLKQAFESFKVIPADILYLQSKLLWRNKEFQKAFDLISTINDEFIAEKRKQDYFNLKAKCFESLKQYANAYKYFSKMNSVTKKTADFTMHNPKAFLKNTKNQLAMIKAKPALKFETSTDNKVDTKNIEQTFLVGFPRSGTTLLDTILRSHSAIEVVEEQPAVALANQSILKSGNIASPGQILPSSVFDEAKKAYKKEFYKTIEKPSPEKVYIDKLPLNLLEVPLINALFPEAKFLLALRHPFDAILSCWMQNFKLNAAMATMVDLDQIVKLYCLAMETFKTCRIKYKLNVHTIKYEDLLEDIKGESTPLLKFLDLNWEIQMTEYRSTALKRGRINTPSYSQVSQPIYKDAKYRWINYKNYLDKYSDVIEPWIDEFGYEKL